MALFMKKIEMPRPEDALPGRDIAYVPSGSVLVWLRSQPAAKGGRVLAVGAPDYGARPLKRAIEQQLEDPLAEEVLRGHWEEGAHLIVTVQDGELHFEEGEKPAEEETEQEAAAEAKE